MIHHPTYIAKINELDANRSNGEWRICPHQYYGRPYTWAIASDDRDVCGNNELYALLADGLFIAESPNLLAAYRDLLGIAQELIWATQQCHAELESIHGVSGDRAHARKHSLGLKLGDEALFAASARGLGEE